MLAHRTLITLGLVLGLAACSASETSEAPKAPKTEKVKPVKQDGPNSKNQTKKENATNKVQKAKRAPKLPALAAHTVDASATLLNRKGKQTGKVALYQGTDGVVLRLSLRGLKPGVHGMHFHDKGTCDDAADGFKATGGHVMPHGKPHGYMNSGGPHAGNLPNLIVHKDGTALVELYSSLVSLTGGPANLLDADGATLIIHENEDDHDTQPIGGAGGRVACGVIKAGG